MWDAKEWQLIPSNQHNCEKYLSSTKNQNINFETIILEKLKGYAKVDTFVTFYDSFLEIKYFASSKLQKFKEENEKSRSLASKIQL